ncbi:MAG: tetratricopeptide repeat protein [Myxococcales bacterium]|nr:tetratricopeptide repeat protein [Myxococcales bacterium]
MTPTGTMNRTVCWWAGGAMALLIALAGPAAAGEEEAIITRVRALFHRGTTHYNLTEYKEALADFTEAYRLKPDAAFLFNVAQSYRQLGEPERAAQFYRNYLREAKSPPNRVEVEKFIADADATIAARRAAAQPTAVQAPQLDAPGAGRPPAKVETPAAPVAAQVTQAPPAAPPSPGPPSTREMPRSRTWLWVTIGVVAAVVIGAGVGLGVALGGSHEPETKLGTFTAVFQ